MSGRSGGSRPIFPVIAFLVLLVAQRVVAKEYVVKPSERTAGIVPNAIGIGKVAAEGSSYTGAARDTPQLVHL